MRLRGSSGFLEALYYDMPASAVCAASGTVGPGLDTCLAAGNITAVSAILPPAAPGAAIARRPLSGLDVGPYSYPDLDALSDAEAPASAKPLKNKGGSSDGPRKAAARPRDIFPPTLGPKFGFRCDDGRESEA